MESSSRDTRSISNRARLLGQNEAYVKVLARLLFMQANATLTPEARNALVEIGGWVAEEATKVGGRR